MGVVFLFVGGAISTSTFLAGVQPGRNLTDLGLGCSRCDTQHETTKCSNCYIHLKKLRSSDDFELCETFYYNVARATKKLLTTATALIREYCQASGFNDETEVQNRSCRSRHSTRDVPYYRDVVMKDDLEGYQLIRSGTPIPSDVATPIELDRESQRALIGRKRKRAKSCPAPPNLHRQDLSATNPPPIPVPEVRGNKYPTGRKQPDACQTEPTFRCIHCEAPFTDIYNLKRHIRGAHDKSTPKCQARCLFPGCGKLRRGLAAIASSNMTIHVKAKHEQWAKAQVAVRQPTFEFVMNEPEEDMEVKTETPAPMVSS